jgi:hypothetical protein
LRLFRSLVLDKLAQRIGSAPCTHRCERQANVAVITSGTSGPRVIVAALGRALRRVLVVRGRPTGPRVILALRRGPACAPLCAATAFVLF